MTLSSDLPLRLSAVSFASGGVAVLAGIDLAVEAGPPVMLIGPNGAGKSTLLRLAMGLAAPSAGEVTWGGRSGPVPGRRAIVFQRPTMLRRSAADNVAYALRDEGLSGRELAQRVAGLLETVGLRALADRPARRLSGGEQQRLALARALGRRPELLFLDEPTANLDPAATLAVERIVADTAAAGVTVVMATHDLGQARRLGARVVFMVAGRIVEDAPATAFFTSPRTASAAAFLAGDIVLS